ncbi:MAG: hypothetical protein DYH12_18175 [Sorangiineae bacterium PRO1]|nr:hypothetical protein [Sorangiineae bacterium PRO1]
MDIESPVYRDARDELVSQLNDAERRIEALLEQLRPFETTKDPAGAAVIACTQAAIRKLARQRSSIAAPLQESSRLAAAARREVNALDETIEAVTREVAALTTTANAATVNATAKRMLAELEKGRTAILDLMLAYRLKQQLHGLRVGRAVDFKASYEKYLPSEDARIAALTEFAGRSDYFDEAVFEIPAQKVWRRSSSYAWRIATCFIPFLVVLAVGGLLALWGVIPWGAETNWDDSGDLVIAYALVFAGVIAHLVVENVKLSQAAKPPITAVGEWIDWMHLRWAGLAGSVVPMVIATLGLLRLGTAPKGEELLVFFFGGYSVDSVAGTILNRFGTAARSGITTATSAARKKP